MDQLIVNQFLPRLVESKSPESVSEGATPGGEAWLVKVGSQMSKPRGVRAMLLATEGTAQWLLSNIDMKLHE